jgi:cation-transporting ATPase E
MLKENNNGLSTAEVAERVARGDVNRVRQSTGAEYAEIVARNLFTLFNALVVPAAIALFALGEYRDGIAVSGMAVANAVLGLAQEIRAKRHLDRLALLAETTVGVLRDGAVREIASGDVVLGDVVLLGAGDTVVADGEVIESRYLEIDEALLTGESDPVSRVAGERVLSGSFAVAGEGRYRADGVGAGSYVQRTAAEARRYRYSASPLQVSVNRLIRLLTVVTVVLCVFYVILGSARNYSQAQVVQMIAATVTSMVPQGLVLMVTLAFVLGAVRLAARGAVAQRLESVETMAVIDTLCMDKTGTLTTGDLRLGEVRLLSEDIGVEEARRLLGLFASASPDRGNKSLAALRALSAGAPIELLDHVPFKSQNRYSAVRARVADDEHVLVLGAPEALTPRLSPEDAARADAARGELMKTGMRLLLFARARERLPFGGSLDGFTLRPLALVALRDELRPEAGGVLRALAEQAIDFKVISGDNPDTVRATIAPLATDAALAALARTPVVNGAELEAAGDAAELIRSRNVFGRVSPWQKVQIVVGLKEAGRSVAMLGDGVNDVLPIKNADLGVAMGSGSRAAKTVAGLVLTTDRFDLLPATLEEGRLILRNLRRAGKLFLVKNVFTVILIVGGMITLNLPFPFLPRQVTLLNALTIGGPALLLTINRQRAAATHSDFLREVGSFVLRTGVVLGAAGLALQWHSAARGDDEDVQRTFLLTALVLLGLLTLLRALTDGEPARSPGDWKYYLLAAVSLALYLAILYWPPARNFFSLVQLGAEQWITVLIAVIAAGAVLFLVDLFVDRQRRSV